jgi:hypothetical protein
MPFHTPFAIICHKRRGRSGKDVVGRLAPKVVSMYSSKGDADEHRNLSAIADEGADVGGYGCGPSIAAAVKLAMNLKSKWRHYRNQIQTELSLSAKVFLQIKK